MNGHPTNYERDDTRGPLNTNLNYRGQIIWIEPKALKHSGLIHNQSDLISQPKLDKYLNTRISKHFEIFKAD